MEHRGLVLLRSVPKTVQERIGKGLDFSRAAKPLIDAASAAEVRIGLQSAFSDSASRLGPVQSKCSRYW